MNNISCRMVRVKNVVPLHKQDSKADLKARIECGEWCFPCATHDYDDIKETLYRAIYEVLGVKECEIVDFHTDIVSYNRRNARLEKEKQEKMSTTKKSVSSEKNGKYGKKVKVDKDEIDNLHIANANIRTAASVLANGIAHLPYQPKFDEQYRPALESIQNLIEAVSECLTYNTKEK